MSCFISYKRPGNIRELKNIIEYLVNIVDINESVITTSHLPIYFTSADTNDSFKTMAQIEKETIHKMLNTFGTSVSDKKKISNILNIGIATLYRKIKQYELDSE